MMGTLVSAASFRTPHRLLWISCYIDPTTPEDEEN